MFRRSSKVDANQREVVKALRKAGASVQHLHEVGRGVPDLLVGFRGENYLMEVKDGSKSKSQVGLTADQVIWIEGWRGSVDVVHSVDDALRAIGGFDG